MILKIVRMRIPILWLLLIYIKQLEGLELDKFEVVLKVLSRLNKCCGELGYSMTTYDSAI